MTDIVIHPDIEPGVIDNELLIRCVLEQGPTEEAGRLFAEEGVHLDEVVVIRLEFKNILRIDHLWMLTSLTRLTLCHNLIEKIENLHLLPGLVELDLSFNKIEVIENLDELVNIEVLSLFHNKIRKLENLEKQEKLLIFSIGDNLIEDYKEAAYLRRFRFLRSVSFKGNVCCDDPMTTAFLKCALWRVTYLDYKKIIEEEREEAQAFFRALLRKLDEADEKSEKERVQREAYNARVEFYALSFVEYLSGPEHFETMFERDPDGILCLQAGGDLIELHEQYKEQYVMTMAELVDFAQKQYSVREKEVNAFKGVVNKALEANVAKSKEIIDEYLTLKKPLMDQLNSLIAEVGAKTITLEDVEPKLIVLMESFNSTLYDVWKKLMHEEITLFEQCELTMNSNEVVMKLMEVSRSAFGLWLEQERVLKFGGLTQETRVQLAVNLNELVTKLMEVSRIAFGLWREQECMLMFGGHAQETQVQRAVNMNELVTKLMEVSRNAFGMWLDQERMLTLGGHAQETRVQRAVNLNELVTKLMEVSRNAFGMWLDQERMLTLGGHAQETRVQRAVNLNELVTKLMEVSRNAFGLWREQECVLTFGGLLQETRVQLAVNLNELVTKLMEMSRNAFGLWLEQERMLKFGGLMQETRVQLAVNLNELVTKLMEVSRNAFGLWREQECMWTVRQGEVLNKLIGNTVLLGDASPDLLELLSDRDTLMNTVAASNDNHMRFIDEREDRITRRANQWKDDLVANTNNNEIKRNRDRILEINYYLDSQREEWADLQMNLMDPAPDQETAALLGDDF